MAFRTHHVLGQRRTYLQRFSLSLTGHVASTVVAIGFERVVGLAPQRQVGGGVRATFAPRMQLREFEAPGLVATVTVDSDR